MKLSPEVHRTIAELYELEAPNWIGAGGVIDMESVIESVRDRLAGEWPDINALFRADAADYALNHIVRKLAAKGEDEFSETHRDMLGIVTRTKRMRKDLAVPVPGGIRQWKGRLDLTQTDVELLIADREKSMSADARELAWLKQQRERFIQLRLPASATVRDLLAVAS